MESPPTYRDNLCISVGGPSVNQSTWNLSSCLFELILPWNGTVNCLIALFSVLSCISMGVNGFTLLGIMKSEELSWQPRFILLKNLVFNDLLMICVLHPTILYCLIQRQTLSLGVWCLIQYYVATTCIFCTIYTLTLMALERYLYICHAIQYINILTSRRVKLGVTLMWLVSFAITGVYLILLHIGQDSLALGSATYGLFCEPDTIEKWMDFPILATIFRKLLGSASILVCVLVFTFSYVKMYREAVNAVEPFNQVNSRARRTILFYCMMFFLQLLPCWLKMVTDILGELDRVVLSDQGSARVLHVVLLLMVIIPPLINPLIFSIRNKELRRALPRVVFRRWVPGSPDTSD